MEVKPFNDRDDGRKEQVRDMFNKIADRYDFLNHLLSFNTDRIWRKKLVKLIKNEKYLEEKSEIKILDVATGTGDLAFALAAIPKTKLTGLDLSEEMLNKARLKSQKYPYEINWIGGDSEDLPFQENIFDFVTVAFGVRNYENLQKGIQEMCRVLKKDGKLIILEFSTPDKKFFGSLYKWYSSKILPRLASLFTSEPRAYTYLPDSIAVFPSGPEMLVELKKAGLTDCRFLKLTGGIASLYSGTKN